MTFLKNDPRPCATLKKVYLDHFELVVAHFGPPKTQNALKMGCFGTKKWVKNGSKRHFSKPHPRRFGVHKRVKWAHYEPILGHFDLLEVQETLKVGLLVMGLNCKLIALCQEPSMCDSFLMSLTSHSRCSLPHQLGPNI